MEPVVENPVAALSGMIDSTAGMERSSPSVSSLPLAQKTRGRVKAELQNGIGLDQQSLTRTWGSPLRK